MATTTQKVYNPRDYTQDQVNYGQRRINYALTQADRALVAVLTLLKDVLQAPPGQVQAFGPRINSAIDQATKAIDRVAGIRPPGCDETWKPDPEPEPETKG